MPAIIAMETSPESSYRDTAALIHKRLNDKHASIIHGQALDCVKKSFDFQCKLAKTPHPLGYRMNNLKSTDEQQQRGGVIHVPEALLSSLHRLMQEKKNRRNEFMHTLVNVFDFNLKTCKPESVRRFLIF